MEAQKLALLPLLREIHALELPMPHLMMVYPWAFLACAMSALAFEPRPQTSPAQR